MPITDRFDRLLRRRAPAEDRVLERFAESYEREHGGHTRYILGAMRAVDSKYTKRLSEQGARIENQLATRLESEYPSLAFRRQGSVSNGTHIRYYSDVDVLTIIDKFVTLEPPQTPTIPYDGEPIDDLALLRRHCVRELSSAFPKVTVNDSGSTAVKLSGGSLACDVDVVPANWFDTNDYARTGQAHIRGIQVLDRNANKRTINAPFLFNFRLDLNDQQRVGLTRMLIRLLKTIKADVREEGSEVDFSSFDICSLVYRMPEEHLAARLNQPLDIISNLLMWMQLVLSREDIRRELLVIDDSRLIFDSKPKTKGLAVLFNELDGIYRGALSEQRGHVLLSESHMR